MGSRKSHLTSHCYHIGNAERYELDSDESSEYSLPTLIPRVESSDDDSDKESNWTNTTEELTDNESIISHESEVPNESIIQIENVRVIESRNLPRNIALPLHGGPGGSQEWAGTFNRYLLNKQMEEDDEGDWV